MWSGPRNISTALMRSWENRPDTFVVDEPLYACYLTRVEVSHPGRDEVIAAHDTDWRRVTRWLTEFVPPGAAIFYQKHMAHHLLPEMDRDWLFRLANCFLIRDPAGMLASLEARMGPPTLRDTGLPQQVEIFREVWEHTGEVPPVIDSADVLKHPDRTLGALCERLGIAFTGSMLHWPPGRRETDGVWAKYWYDRVEQSTGFEPYRQRTVELSPSLRGLLAECRPFYEEMAAYAVR
jgi:hypothetical protein